MFIYAIQQYAYIHYETTSTHPVRRRRVDVAATSLDTSQWRPKDVSNETPNDVSVVSCQDVSLVRLHDVIEERRDDVSRIGP